MRIALDCNALIELARIDDATAEYRMRHLLDETQAALIVPMPALAEFLVKLDASGRSWLGAQTKRRSLQLVAFDRRAAEECALLEVLAKAAGYKPSKSSTPRQHVKVDRQILALARVHSCDMLITSDRGLASMAERLGLTCKIPSELPLAPEDAQQSLPLDAPVGLQAAPPQQ